MIEGVIFLLGLCVGSFLNVLIDRLPKGESIWIDRSKCDFCKKTLRWFELIPLLSFFIQSGRCRRCHKQLSIQYPIVEFVTALGFIYLWQDWPTLLIFCCLLVIFVADLKYMIIPDSMLIVGIIGALFLRPDFFSALGALIFFLVLFLITRGRGMGFGDVKFAFVLGLWLAYPNIIIALYGAFLTGAIVGVTLIFTGQKRLKSKMAFGPFMVLGALIAYLWGTQIQQWWIGMI